MHVLVAIVVLFALIGAGLVGGVWGLSGLLAHQADRIGVGTLRGGLLVNRFRVPMFMWAVGLALVGLILGAVWIRHTTVVVALIVGCAFAAAAVAMIPKVAPAWGVKLARGLRHKVTTQAKRRWGRR